MRRFIAVVFAAALAACAGSGSTGPGPRVPHDPEIYFVLKPSANIGATQPVPDTARMEWYDQRGLLARVTLTVIDPGADSTVVCAFFIVEAPTDSMRLVFSAYDAVHNQWGTGVQSTWWSPWASPPAEPEFWYVLAQGNSIGIHGQSNDTSFCPPGAPRDSITETTP